MKCTKSRAGGLSISVENMEKENFNALRLLEMALFMQCKCLLCVYMCVCVCGGGERR